MNVIKRQGDEVKKRSMDEMISYFNQRVSEMIISIEDKMTILGMITAIGLKYEEDTKAVQPDNQVHLCDSCSYTYPECPSVYTDVIFGNGIGNDNICACSKYLPSAQPEIPDDARDAFMNLVYDELHSDGDNNRANRIIDAADEYVEYSLAKQSAQPEPCEDAVSRKAVIDAIDEWKEACAGSGHKETVSDIKLIRKDFIELPPVTPKQRTGEWLPWEYARPGHEYKFHKCSVCGVCDEYVDEVPRPNGTVARIERIRNFCPNCGAKMGKG